jgi:hypothetical protein
MVEYILYALPKGENRRYMESILATSYDMQDIERAKGLALADKFHSFRVAEFAGEKPNFAGTLNTQQNGV